VYGSLDGPDVGGACTLASILPDADLNSMLTCHSPEPVDGAMMVLRSRERGNRGPVNTVTALEVAFPESTKNWADTKLKRRPPEYYEYKRSRTDSVVGRIREHIPECRDMRVIDSASSLTYRDYLHNPDGSAYGIRQKIGQFNLVGRLPLSNLYAAGQSALLPGVIGAMTSAFFVCRGIHRIFGGGDDARARRVRLRHPRDAAVVEPFRAVALPGRGTGGTARSQGDPAVAAAHDEPHEHPRRPGVDPGARTCRH